MAPAPLPASSPAHGSAAAPPSAAPAKRTRWFWVRVSILLTILLCVSLYAIRDYRSRHGRNDWDRTLDVSFIVIREGPVTEDAISALRARVPVLEAQLLAQMQRYRKTTRAPVRVTIRGPVDGAPPAPSPGTGLLDALAYQWKLWRWTRTVDDLAHFDPGGTDSRIYLVTRPPVVSNGKIVRQIEGASELNGRVGVVSVDLDPVMADFALFVATHELAHTLGATDKYAPDGSILVPAGLPEPNAFPLYPQQFAEVMARHRAIDDHTTKPPKDLGELAIGAETAREIGWTK